MIYTELVPHQVEAVKKCLSLTRHICAVDTGGGKTLIGLKVIEEIKKRGPVDVSLVVCPKTAMVNTWEREIIKHTDFSYSIGSVDPRKDVSVISFPTLNETRKQLQSMGTFRRGIIWVDECHVLKSPDSQQALFLRDSQYGIMRQFEYQYGATATPLLNHIEDIYFLVNSFFPDFFDSYNAFMSAYAIQEDRSHVVKGRVIKYKETVGYRHLDHLFEILKQVMFRHVINYNIQWKFELCDLNKDEFSTYLSAAEGTLREDKYRNFVSRLPDLQQIVNGSIVAEGYPNREPILTSKEAALVKLLRTIRERGEGAVVFTYFLSTMDRFPFIASHLDFDNYYFIHGNTKNAVKDAAIKNLCAGEVMFATKIGGTSLNLQAVNNVIFYDLPWSVGEIIQYIGRISRMDTTYEDLRAYVMSARETIDDYKVAMLSSNLDMVRTVIGGFGFTDVYFNAIKRHQIIELRKSLLWKTAKTNYSPYKQGNGLVM